MNWRMLTATALLGAAVTGCDSIPFLSKSDTPDTTQTAVQPAAADAGAVAAAQPAPPPQRQPAPAVRPVAVAPLPVDEPWTPTDTGTVDPGMSLDQVIAVWGEPVAERAIGNWTYLYYRNGCEVTCGTFDVVFLMGDQVVDAIVRGPGHSYSGTSSSPPYLLAEPTLPGAPGETTD